MNIYKAFEKMKGLESTIQTPIFEININYHPEMNIEPNWQRYNMVQYMCEFDVDIDTMNDMIQNNAVRLIDVSIGTC